MYAAHSVGIENGSGVEPLNALTPTAQPTVEELYRDYASTVARWATRLSGRAADSADVVHEVFLIVHQRLPTVQLGSDELVGWLFGITRNVMKNRRRRERVRQVFLRREELLMSGVVERSPHALVEQEMNVRRFYEVLNGLSEIDRALLVLFELEGYSGQQVAALLELKFETIWVRLHRARDRFNRRLLKLEPELRR